MQYVHNCAGMNPLCFPQLLPKFFWIRKQAASTESFSPIVADTISHVGEFSFSSKNWNMAANLLTFLSVWFHHSNHDVTPANVNKTELPAQRKLHVIPFQQPDNPLHRTQREAPPTEQRVKMTRASFW